MAGISLMNGPTVGRRLQPYVPFLLSLSLSLRDDGLAVGWILIIVYVDSASSSAGHHFVKPDYTCFAQSADWAV